MHWRWFVPGVVFGIWQDGARCDKIGARTNFSYYLVFGTLS